METLLVFAVAEVAIMSTLTTLQLQAQETIVKKWREGSLSLEELQVLKSRRWFQRRIWKPAKSIYPPEKKTN